MDILINILKDLKVNFLSQAKEINKEKEQERKLISDKQQHLQTI